ncbi:MAG: hemerythrin domain-containing protein [Deltaproteobacteria bacterium]|nr:hemerythrin domain-containing protein [Deltaproteobacteria bacterium]
MLGQDSIQDFTQGLSQEHMLVLEELDMLERALKAKDLPRIAGTLRFFDEKVALHRRKEEEILFPALAKFPPIAHGPIACMLEEHREEKRLLEEIRHSLDAIEKGGDAWARLRASVAGVLSLLRAHIMKEDKVLFPLAERTLVEEDAAKVRRRMEEVGYFFGPSAQPRLQG